MDRIKQLIQELHEEAHRYTKTNLECYQSLNILIDALEYLVNSYSFTADKLYDFDKNEIKRLLTGVLL